MAKGADGTDSYTVVVTRAAEQCAEFLALLEGVGLRGFALPVIEIEPIPLTAKTRPLFDSVVQGRWNWLVFPSVNAVRSFAALLSANRLELKSRSMRIAVQGSASAAACRQLLGCEPALIPANYVADDLLAELLVLRGADSQESANPRVCVAGAEEGRDVVVDGLLAEGIAVEKLALYRTVPCRPDQGALDALAAHDPTKLIISFLSPSAFENFMSVVPSSAKILAAAVLASVGPVTSAAIRQAGYDTAITASPYTAPALVDAIARFSSADVQSRQRNPPV